MKTNYFEDSKGNKSSSRLIGFIVIMYALLLVTAVILIGVHEKSSVIQTAVAAGTLFTTIAGPAMYYLFNNKREEIKISSDEQP